LILGGIGKVPQRVAQLEQKSLALLTCPELCLDPILQAQGRFRLGEVPLQICDGRPFVHASAAIGGELEKVKDADPHSVVVVRNGVVIYEKYFSGPDQRWPQRHWGEPFENMPHDLRTKHDLQSITKSVASLLLGIALDRAMIKRVDAPLLSFFPEYADLSSPGRERITLRDLLTMQTGFDWPAKPYLSMAQKVDAAPDPYRRVLEQPMVAELGKRWRYNNGVAGLVGVVVQKVTGLGLTNLPGTCCSSGSASPTGNGDEWPAVI
jgi:CubicO group peptidase (beta-lactamase class C family)